MKKILIALMIISLSGCSITNSILKSSQPEGVKYFKPDQGILHIKAGKFLLEGKVTETTYPDGRVVRTQDEVEFWVKDTGAKPPMTILDFLAKGLNIFGLCYGINEAFGSMNNMSSGLSRDPTIVNTPRADIISTNSLGETTVTRG